MTSAEAYKLILQRWMTLWHTLVGGTQAAPTVPYALDNIAPTMLVPPFVQLTIENLGSEQVTFGMTGLRRFERSGFIDAQLFGERNRGRAELDTLAAHVITIYEAQDLSGVRTYSTNITEVRNDLQFPNLWCLLVRTPFEFHHKR